MEKNCEKFELFETVCLDKNIKNIACTTLDEQLNFVLRQKSKSEPTLEVANGAPILVVAFARAKDRTIR